MSPEQQKQIIFAFAKAHGHEVVAWADDPSVSGDTSPFERPALGPWLTEDKADEFDGVAAFKIDRLSRRLLHFAELIAWADQRKKKIIAVSDGIDTSTRVGKMVAQIVAILAEWELDTIRERIQGTKAYMRRTPRFVGGKVPFGYKAVASPDGKGKVLAADPESAAVVRGMVDKILDGWSMAAVRADLARRGVLAPTDLLRARRGEAAKGTPWSTRAVALILRSRALLGEAEHKGRVIRGPDGLPLQRAEPLITPDRFARLQAKLDEAAKPRAYRNPTALLADLLRCGSCGGNLYKFVQRRRRGDREYVWKYYRCQARTNGKTCDRPTSVRADALDELVTTAVLHWIGAAERQGRQWRPAEDHTEELAQVEQAIAECREEWDLGLYEGDRGSYLARLQGLTERRKALAALPARPGGWEYVGLGETYGDAWARMTDAERRGLLLAAGIEVTVGSPKPPNEIELEWSNWDGKDIPVRRPPAVTIAVPKDFTERVRAGGLKTPAPGWWVQPTSAEMAPELLDRYGLWVDWAVVEDLGHRPAAGGNGT